MSGVFFENYVAPELKAYNLPLYFWKGKNDAEFEFLLKDRINQKTEMEDVSVLITTDKPSTPHKATGISE